MRSQQPCDLYTSAKEQSCFSPWLHLDAQTRRCGVNHTANHLSRSFESRRPPSVLFMSSLIICVCSTPSFFFSGLTENGRSGSGCAAMVGALVTLFRFGPSGCLRSVFRTRYILGMLSPRGEACNRHRRRRWTCGHLLCLPDCSSYCSRNKLHCGHRQTLRSPAL